MKAKVNENSKEKTKKWIKQIPQELRSNPELHRYWKQRFELFSRFNAGIKLDQESWYSVTPEFIAKHIAERCSTDGVIVDGFCGCGGNAIQFAKYCGKVIAVDIDATKLENCRHNARIYGVEDKIEFVLGDFTELALSLKADVVFLSPPWGGPSYSGKDAFDIETMIPMNGVKLFSLTQKITPNIAYYLPRNSDLDQITQLAGEGKYVEIEKNIFKGRVKAITAYYGNLIKQDANAT